MLKVFYLFYAFLNRMDTLELLSGMFIEFNRLNLICLRIFYIALTFFYHRQIMTRYEAVKYSTILDFNFFTILDFKLSLSLCKNFA